MTTPNIYIATPMYGSMCHARYTEALIHLTHKLRTLGYLCCYNYVVNESSIERARNELVAHFLHNTDCTHLLFIDADISFDADDVMRLIAANVDVVAGMYPKKYINWDRLKDAIKQGKQGQDLQYAAHDYSFISHSGVRIDINANRTDLVEVDGAGTGMMLIRRSVLQQLAKGVDIYTPSAGISAYKTVPYLFKCGIDNNKFSTEDANFCRLWTNAGGKIYIAPWMKLCHTGSMDFGRDL